MSHTFPPPRILLRERLFFWVHRRAIFITGVFISSSLLFPSVCGAGQSLRGTVRDAQTLLPVPYAEALAVKEPYFQPFSIPAGIYASSVPATPVSTVATMAVLAARQDVRRILVHETLIALYERFPPTRFPTVVRAHEAAEWSNMRLHDAAKTYHNP